MGAYLDTPVTAKQSSHGVCHVGAREVVYASTAVQGWRVNMEDAHIIVPDFDENTALLAVFDGHGGKEVAEYCSRHMPEMLQSNLFYKSGDLPKALKQLFVDTDKKLLEKDVIRELKRYVAGVVDYESEVEVDSSEEKEEASKLVEEANMPLDALLAQYVTGSDEEGGEDEEESSDKDGGIPETGDQVRSMLQALASQAGFEIEFEESSDSEDSEYESEDIRYEGEEEKEGEEEGEGEERAGDGAKNATVVDGGGEKGHNETEQTLELYKEHGVSKTDSTESTLATSPITVDTKTSHATSTPHTLENNLCLHNNIKERALGVVAPLSAMESVSSDFAEKQINGRTDHLDSGRSTCNSKPAVSASTCATDEDHSSKSHLLLDLLTSAVGNQPPKRLVTDRGAIGARESRKRRRGEGTYESNDTNGTNKRSCRGVLDEEGYHSGTTAVLCLLRENSLTVANAGDSRCVLSCRGRAVDMSEDHKPTDEAELSRIQRAGGIVGADGRVNGGLNLSRAIGDHFYKENTNLPLEQQMISAVPDVESRELQAGDEFIVLACDGIWNTKSSQEVVDFVQSRLSERSDSQLSLGSVLERICESLCDACLASDTDNDGTGCDNMTVAIAILQSPSSFISTTT